MERAGRLTPSMMWHLISREVKDTGSDLPSDSDDGNQLTRSRKVITFITYIDQENTSVKVSLLQSQDKDMKPVINLGQARMTYASSRETLKNSLNGIGMNWQANEPGELEWQPILKEASKGKASA